MSSDERLGTKGQGALREDRRAFFSTAPTAPNITNVDSKGKDTDDSDNYRNDLLKKFCTKDPNNVSGLSGTNLMDNLKEYGKRGTRNREKILTDMNTRINQIAGDAGDGASQIKYLLCQQADAFVAPPLPSKSTEGSKSGQFWKDNYMGTHNWTNWLFAIIGWVFMVLYLVKAYNNAAKSAFFIYLIMSVVFFVLCLIVLFQDRCIPGANRYYHPEESDPIQSTIYWLLGISLILGLGLMFIAHFVKGNRPDIARYMAMSGFGLLMVLGLATDGLFLLFQPQVFVLAMIILRFIYWSIIDSKTWTLPITGITIEILKRYSNKDYANAVTNLNVENERAFGWLWDRRQ